MRSLEKTTHNRMRGAVIEQFIGIRCAGVFPLSASDGVATGAE